MTCLWILYQLLTGGTQKRGDFRIVYPWMGYKSSPEKKILSSFVYVTNIYGEIGIMKTDRQNNGEQSHW
jgi:hypothetical protein